MRLHPHGVDHAVRTTSLGEVTNGPGDAQANLPKWVNCSSAIWLDFDRDGHLDLFLGAYWREDVNLWKLDTTKIMPESFKYAENGGRKYLLRNRG